MATLTSQFLGLSGEDALYEKSSVIVLPVPLEKTTSYMKGTKGGPAAIIEASHQVEFYDAELGKETWPPGIHTLPPLDFSDCSSEEALTRIEKQTARLFSDKKFPILLGGEHSLSGGSIRAAAQRYNDLSVLQIDAHADYRESYEGSPYSHASAMRLAARDVQKIVGVGIRSVCSEEIEFAAGRPGLNILFDHERIRNKNWIEKALQGLTENVYLTVDVDGFTPELIPATGTPEPGGLSWYEGCDLIRALFQKKNVVAADVVELLPMPNQHASSFTTAKLVYKLVGFWKKYS